MNLPPLRRIPSALLYKKIRPAVWNLLLQKRMHTASDEKFFRSMGWSSGPAEFVDHVHAKNRHRFFFHPRNRKDFFLNLLTTSQPYDSILEEAELVLANRFQTLGSPLTELGDPLRWQLDFKSGKEWELAPSRTLDILDLKNPSDVKVPWELSRFHQVWWLGKASWLTGNMQYAEKFKSLVDHWIASNPVGYGVNWAIAMEAAIRSCNWIAGYYFFCESTALSKDFWIRFFRSLLTHGRFIESHLEYARVNGNHFLSNVVGLIFLGMFFRDLPIGKRWLDWGVARLQQEMQEQVYDDGVNHEKSTAYHRLVLEFFQAASILCQQNNIPLSQDFLQRLELMTEFVQQYTRPDGSIPNVGDADDGRLFRVSMNQEINDHRHALSVGAIQFGRADFKATAGRFDQDALWYYGGEGFERHQLLGQGVVDPRSRSFALGGFHTLHSRSAHLFLDTGDIGMRGRGGHGHNDTLSFELWIAGAPFVVDSGTYSYTFDKASRQKFRSIAAHNTICVDGVEPAIFDSLWSIKADTTRPKVLSSNFSDDGDFITAEYQCAPGILHRRALEMARKQFRLLVHDTISGTGVHRVSSRLYFHPSCSVSITDDVTCRVRGSVGTLTIKSSLGPMKCIDSFFSPSYGTKIPNSGLEISIEAHLPLTLSMEFSFEPAA